ncbi:GNAT family N-acetyltransferase [Streptomyces kanasensis]|uniref:GNAT family N-acetyltransferase n=1 Tax=Streptomyces kanasensis TaxID=936756 RepID=UPI00370119C2
MAAAASSGPVAVASTVCREDEHFGALATDWADLYDRCATVTPFQTHAWLHSWWLSYGVPGRLRVVLVRRVTDGRLVAAAPLWLTPGRAPTVAFLGGDLTDYGDVLVDEGCPGALPALAAALADLPELTRGAVVDLREVRPGAAAERLLAPWPGPRRRYPDSTCLELPCVPVDDLVRRLPSARAQRARAKLRRIDREGITARHVPADEVPGALDHLLDLHRRQWVGRGVTAEHLTSRFAEHLGRAVRGMAGSGHACVTEFLLGDEVVAVDLTLLSPRISGGYLYGADPMLRSLKVDLATLLLRNSARLGDGTDRTTLSLLRGDEPYKHHWRPDAVRNGRLLLARRRAAPLLWLRAAYVGGRGRAADRLRDRAWARALRHRLAGGPAAAPTGRTARGRTTS